ncbi:MAG: dockerin type I domain-containing protein [Fimbriimonadales bacterium]
MKHTYWMGVLMGAFLAANAPAQIVYSFETEDLHGYADDAGDDWQVFRAQTGVTHGDYSMAVLWPSNSGGFRWLSSNGVRDELLPFLQISKKLLLDVTVPEGQSVEWANMVVSLNGPTGYGWNQAPGLVGLPRQSGTRTVLIDLESLSLPASNVDWFQLNLGFNAGESHQLYLDSLRLYRSACEMTAFTFDDDLQGFNIGEQTGVTLTWVDGKMRVESEGGFKWLFGGSVPGLAAMVRRGDLVVMDVTIVSAPPGGWGNIIMSINSPAGWGQSNYVAEVAQGANTFTRTIALDYRDATLPSDDTPEYCTLNLGINSGGAMTIEIDNIRIYRRAIEGDVNCDGCVDDADLLSVLFEFGSTAITPADVNGDGVVDDADLLMVLFNFGQGC